METNLKYILETIDNEDNIYYFYIIDENTLPDIMNQLHDLSVESLCIINVARENLFDRFFDYLKHEQILTKHKYIFVDNNLPKLYKLKIKIKEYNDLLECKCLCPSLNNTKFYINNNNKGEYIISIY